MSVKDNEAQHFKPWVGEAYGSAATANKRVMVLGESHYEWLDDQTVDADWTSQFIKNDIQGAKQRFRTRLAATFAGRRLTTVAERHTFWHSIVFANYIPVSVGKGANVNPTEEMWAAAVPRFAALVTTHNPDLVLVLGHELWMRLHYSFIMDGRPEHIPNDLNQWRSWRYRYPNGKTMLAGAIKHPSRNFNFGEWHPYVKKLIEAA